MNWKQKERNMNKADKIVGMFRTIIFDARTRTLLLTQQMISTELLRRKQNGEVRD